MSNTKAKSQGKARKGYGAPKVRTYGNIREITMTQAPVVTNKRDSGSAKTGGDKTLVP